MIKNLIYMSVLTISIIVPIDSFAQSAKIDKYFDQLPHRLKPNDTSPLSYKLTIDWENRDIDGGLLNHNVADATFTKGLENDSIVWTNVVLTSINDNVRNENKLTELEGLKYKIIGDNFTKPDFYNAFPQKHIDLIRWLVQDQFAIDVYGLMYFDSLKFNKPFTPDFFRNHKANFDNYVNFNTKNLNITWTGISKINNKICALIHYQALYNPIDADNDAMKINGRSCFWGDIWISLDNRQIEFATMSEDLIFKMRLKANNYEQRINLQREVKFEKIK